jgi:hypothetical protein
VEESHRPSRHFVWISICSRPSSLSCFSAPAFGVASRPRSARFPQGQQSRNWESAALEGNDLGGLRFQPRLGSWRARRRGITLPMIRNPCRFGSSAGGSWEKSDTPVGEGRSSLPTWSMPPLNRESTQNAEPGRAMCGFLHRAEHLFESLLRRKPTLGNPRRHPLQPSLGQRRRPPRSFSGGAILSQFL